MCVGPPVRLSILGSRVVCLPGEGTQGRRRDQELDEHYGQFSFLACSLVAVPHHGASRLGLQRWMDR
jgi:hypothetical protein